jgi:hypothetical protein
MKKAKLLLILLTIGALTYSQKNQVSVNVGINNAFKTTKNNNPYADLDDNILMTEIGLGYSRKLSGNLFFSTGLSYSPKGYNRGPLVTYRSGNFVFGNDYKFYEKRRFYFAEIPAGIKVFLLNKKNYRIGVEGGLVNQFLVRVTQTPYDVEWQNPIILMPGGPEPVEPKKQTYGFNDFDEYGFRSYNLGLYGNLGFHYKIHKAWLGISVFAKRSLLSTAKEDGPYYESRGERFYSFGIGLSFSHDY